MSEIILHQPPGRPWGSPNLSPFCAKLETYLRMADVPYTIGKFSRGDAPKGKVPYVKLDGRFVGDSQLIIDELEKRAKQPLDAGLSAHDAATGHLARRTLEEAFYFIGLFSRWDTDDAYAETAREFKKFVPGFVVPLIRRAMRKKLHEQGTGRHSREEAMALGKADWTALAELLGDKPFFLGDQPRTIDCTLFAFVEAVVPFPVDSPIKQAITKHANLIAYRDRIRARWWKDLS